MSELPKSWGDQVEAPATAAPNQQSIWAAILFAFIGGLILNVMPCVLPVLSVKILQILSHSGDDRGKILLNAWSYTFGVFDFILDPGWCFDGASRSWTRARVGLSDAVSLEC